MLREVPVNAAAAAQISACFREPPPDPTIVPRQALEKIRLLVESKLDQDHEAVLRVEPQHQKGFVVDVLDTFITVFATPLVLVLTPPLLVPNSLVLRYCSDTVHG